MTLWLSSYIALWILVALLSVALFSLARQIGLLHRRLVPVGARITNVGPSIGDTITPFAGVDINSNPVSIPASDGRRTALVFVSSTCPACDELAPALRSIAEDEDADLRMVLASFNGNDATNRVYAAKHALEGIQFVVSPELARTFSVLTTPYAIIIDEQGVVRTKGLINSREHLESLLNAVEGGHESIQAFRFAQGSLGMAIEKKDIGTQIGTEGALSGE